MYVYTDINGYDIVNDTTQGRYFSKYWGCGTTDAAEFIVERNGYNNPNGSVPLSHFSNLYWHYTEFEDTSNNWYDESVYGQYLWQLQNNSHQALITESGVGFDSYGNNFTYYWIQGS